MRNDACDTCITTGWTLGLSQLSFVHVGLEFLVFTLFLVSVLHKFQYFPNRGKNFYWAVTVKLYNCIVFPA